MSTKSMVGLFIAEGSSDQPLAEIVESLFFERGALIHLSAPDFSLLPDKVKRDVQSKIRAGIKLSGQEVDLIVVHRDADNLEPCVRRDEIVRAVEVLDLKSTIIPVVPVKMTEAWLLLDEAAIRQVAGNPRGQNDLGLPKPSEAERKADPKRILQDSLLMAAGVSGRRREGVAKRFGQHRRQLLERLDQSGPVSTLDSWTDLVSHVESAIAAWDTE